VGDIPKPKIGNAVLYSNWNGHIIPFLDTPLTSYNCETKVTIYGKTRWRDSATGTSVHDDELEFWSTYGDTTYSSSPYYFDGNHCSAETANEFNRRFEGLACLLPMSAVNEHRGYHLVSFVEPTKKVDGSLNEMGLKYDNFLKDKGVGTRYSKYEYYDGEYNYLTGSANLLFGDGSVSIKNQAWLFNNRRTIATDQDVK
jgi:prepilin-type processing-associated H-X9-DG protein